MRNFFWVCIILYNSCSKQHRPIKLNDSDITHVKVEMSISVRDSILRNNDIFKAIFVNLKQTSGFDLITGKLDDIRKYNFYYYHDGIIVPPIFQKKPISGDMGSDTLFSNQIKRVILPIRIDRFYGREYPFTNDSLVMKYQMNVVATNPKRFIILNGEGTLKF